MPANAATPRRLIACRLLAWAGAVAAMLVSYVRDWTVPLLGIAVHPQHGHVLLEAEAIVHWSLIGSLLGGWWWNARPHGRIPGAAAIALWSIVGLIGWTTREAFWSGLVVWMLPALIAHLTHARERWLGFKGFLATSSIWNAAFAACWFIILLSCDAVLFKDAPHGWLSATDALIARALTHLVIAGGVWLMLACHDRWAPGIGRWLAWSVVAIVPLLSVLNTALRVWWGKGAIEMFGELLVGGRFELERAWAAGGVELNAATIASAIAIVLALIVIFWLCAWYSRRRPWHFSLLHLSFLTVGAWMLLQADQFAGSILKDRAWRWWERKTFQRRMTWIEPDPGLATYRVQFADTRVKPQAQTFASKPDVFLFMVESLRADALRPDVAPFLCRMRDEECQPIAESWAASNVTHQSWFSILSGRLPVFMESARQEKKLAPLPALLKAGGYRIEARMVNNFDYMDMVSANFGSPGDADVVEHVNAESPENFYKVSQRELRMLDRLKQSIVARPPGGLCAISGMDSTHYNYKWHTSFTPPFADFEENPIFPMRPSPDEVRRITHRYWNSVAWIDHCFIEFIGWLKSQGRYDDALIVITGDHGEEFKEQGSWFHGTTLNEPQTHVPLLIKWPRSLGVGRGPAIARASHLDVLPSLCDALGCDRGTWQSLPGESLLHPRDGERSIITCTHFCGRNGEALLLRRGQTEAAFGWANFWIAHVPDAIWLERTRGCNPEGWSNAFATDAQRVFAKLESR